MSDGILTLLKLCLMALLYLFLLRVVWVVGSELRGGAAAAIAEPAADGRPARRKSWRLAVIEPDTDGREFDIDGELTIGRAGGCGISLLDDTYASQVHARVFERDGNAYVEDLGSTNGTLVNGEPTTQTRRLRKGDRLQIGQTVLEASR